MTAERRKQLLLVVLALVLVIALWIRIAPWIGSGAGRGGSGFFGGGEAAVHVDLTGEVLELAELGPEIRSHEVRRDPFRFGELPRPVQPPPPPRPQQVVERPAPPPPIPVDLGPQPPPVDLTYLGWFGPKQRPIAVLTDGEVIFNAREGDEVGEHFRVKAIGLESVDIEFKEFPDVPARRLVVGS